MADPFKPAPSVASRFVSQTELSEAQAKREANVRAAYARLGQEPPPEALAAARGGEAGEYDPRSLYERLQANKNAKQEKFDDMMKLSNQFRGLDEDETAFLADVAAEKRAEEARKRAEEEDELNAFRRATTARAASPPNPLALLTGAASTSPPAPKASAAPSSTSGTGVLPALRLSGASGVADKVAGGSSPIKASGGKRAAEEVGDAESGRTSQDGKSSDAKKIKEDVGPTAASSSKTTSSVAVKGSESSGSAAAAARKKKAGSLLGVVRKKPAK